MATLLIYYKDHTERYSSGSLWAANLIAINHMRANDEIVQITIVDNEANAIHKVYVRE